MYRLRKKKEQKPKNPQTSNQNQNDRLLTQSLELKIIPKAYF